MHIGFQQGIISHPKQNNQQAFLEKRGSYVSLLTQNSTIELVFTKSAKNYLFTESFDVNNAWGPLLPNTDYWLFWDIDTLTAKRTFGFTTVEPIVGSIQPTGVIDLHWFDTVNQTMYVYQTDGWRAVIRLFAAKVNNQSFVGLGSGLPTKKLFTGTQVGLSAAGLTASYIALDYAKTPIRTKSDVFFNVDDKINASDSPIHTINFEPNILRGVAREPILQFQIVSFTRLGKINLAKYADVQSTILAIALEDIDTNSSGVLCAQGIVTNNNWNFSMVGAQLWVNTNGQLVNTDPFIDDPINNPKSKSPVARVISPNSIFFDPGLGNIGIRGDKGINVVDSTINDFGIIRLSVPAVDPNNPITVGDNDPRLMPYTHPATHPSTMVTTNSYGILTGSTLNLQLEQLIDRSLDSFSDVVVPSPTIGNFLKWNGSKWTDAPKPVYTSIQYLNELTDVVITTPTTGQVLKYNGTNWINDSLILTLTGDATGVGSTTIPMTLATVNSTVGTFGSSSSVASFTVNEKGLITSIVDIPVSVGAPPTILDGTAWSWGNNFYGQLGQGNVQPNGSNETTKSLPTQVGSLTDWRQITGGYFTGGGIRSDGTLWTWGYNPHGEMGVGHRIDTYSPTQVGSLTDWDKLAFGEWHGLAIKKDGTLWSWGQGFGGQLGLGFDWHISSPMQVGSLTNWKQVDGGDYFSAAIKTDGTLWTWGGDDFSVGKLGLGSIRYKSSPTQVGTLTDWKQVACGHDFMVAVKTDGTLWTCGYNGDGQLGDGTTIDKSSPVQIGALTNWAKVACNHYSTLAVKLDGTLWAWGENSAGELGDGTRTKRSSPVQIGSLTDWAQVAGSAFHSMAIKTDGTLWSWGAHWGGQLGIGGVVDNTSYRSSPVQVGSLTNWIRIDKNSYEASYAIQEPPLPIIKGGTSNTDANSAFNALAPAQAGYSGNLLVTDGVNTSWTPVTVSLSADNALWAWGQNNFGQLGLGTNVTTQPRISSPLQVGSLTDWKIIGSGGWQSISAIKRDGTLWSWGLNDYGQLGDGTIIRKSSPVQVGALTDWKIIVDGTSHRAAIKQDGTLWTWGNNTYGQLGLGDTVHRSSPVQVGSLTNWKQVTGGLQILAIKTDGTLWACGYNVYGGPLGDGTRTNKSSFIQIGSLNDWAQVSTFEWNSAAIKKDGTLWTWGINNYGQLGDGTTVPKSSPIQVGSLTDWRYVSVGYNTMLALKHDGTMWTWGYNFVGELGDGTSGLGADKSSPIQIGMPYKWKHIVSGYTNSTAIREDNTLWAWGQNNYGEIGDGTSFPKSSPTQVGSLTSWRTISMNAHVVHGLISTSQIVPIESGGTSNITANDAINALLPSQKNNRGEFLATTGKDTFWKPIIHYTTLSSWGQNNYGQLGDGTVVKRSSPVQIGSLSDWTKVSCGRHHVAAITATGTLWSWGRDSYGQLGDGASTTKSSPIQIGNLTNWKQVACGYYHTAAIKKDGTLWAWGANFAGQLGDGNSIDKSSPIQIGSLNDWKYVSSGYYHTAAIKTDGTLWTWGYNAFGTLGDGTTTWRSSPIQIGSLTDWKQIGSLAGSNHIIAIKTDGTLWAWGQNGSGQLGDGTRTNRSSPVQIGILNNWNYIACGTGGGAAIKTDGTLWCWGDNYYGQLGDGTRIHRSSPVQIGSLTDWKYVTPGYKTTMAIKNNNSLWGWGENWQGPIGDGTIASKSSPIQIGSLTNWVDISTHEYYTVGMQSTNDPLSIEQGGLGSAVTNTSLNNILPTQAGNTSKLLTTDGNVLFWDIPANLI